MGRLFLWLFYYVLAMLLGFHLRGRYDLWSYSKPHMQARLSLFAQEVALARTLRTGKDDPETPNLFLPPSTLDRLAMNPKASTVAVRQREDELAALLRERYETEPEPGGEPAPAPPDPDPAAAPASVPGGGAA